MAPLAMIGTPEIIGIVVVVVILFGARRIPEIMKGVGEGVTGFRKGLRGDTDETDKDKKSDGSPPP